MTIYSINTANMLDLPCLVYCKNEKGKYFEANNYLSRTAGLNKGEDIIGLTDFDLCWKKNEATSYQLGDIKVMSNKKAHTFLENITDFDQKTHPIITCKVPLTNHRDKVIGVLGLTYLLDHTDLLLEQLIIKKSPIEIISSVSQNKRSGCSKQKNHGLSKRQVDCIILLTKGMTSKMIAEELNLSKRTIDHYIEMLKIKLKCASKSELVEKALKFSFEKHYLTSIMDKDVVE